MKSIYRERTSPPERPGTPSPVATGTLTFDANGNLTAPTAPAQVHIAITGLADGANDMNINWNLATDNGTGTPVITQYAATSAVSASTQDGVPASQVTQVSIANGGAITAQFSNGNQLVIGQLALASVSNPDSYRGRPKQLRSGSRYRHAGDWRSRHRHAGNGGRRIAGNLHGEYRHRVY